MTFKVTERDKKLLVLLAMFIIAVAAVVLFIMPSLETASQLKENIEIANMDKTKMENDIQLFASSQKTNEKLTEELTSVSKNFYGLLDSNEIDKMLTGMVLNSGLSVKNLVITPNDVPKTISPYYASMQAVTDNAENQKDQASDAKGEKAYIYVYTIAMEVQGSQESIQRLVDLFSSSAPSLRITSYDYTQPKEDSVSSARIGLEIYMCMQ